MKNRTIPYGYQYADGVIAIQQQEQTTVKDICKAYLGGESLLNIATWLNEKGIEYMPGVTGWNKSRLKRIIEDERYLGKEPYPAIIDIETYTAMQNIKAERNTQKGYDRQADIFQIGVPVKCPICGSVMQRRHDSRLKNGIQRWTCQNTDCRKLIAKADEELLGEITDLLNIAIANPDMIRIPTNTDREPSIEVRRLDNEIGRTLEGFDFDKDDLRTKMLRRVSLKYQDIVPETYTAKRLRADLTDANPLSVFSADLFARTVKAIRFSENGTVRIILINDQQIGKEQTDDSNSSGQTAESNSGNTGNC